MVLTPAAFGMVWPTFALVVILFFAWIAPLLQRSAPERDRADRQATPPFDTPILFFVAVLLMLLVHQADYLQVVLGWIYVALYALHAILKIGTKQGRAPLLLDLACGAVLSAIWIGLFIDTFHAASVLARIE